MINIQDPTIPPKTEPPVVPVEMEGNVSDKPKKKTKWNYIIGGIILLMLVIGGGAGYWLTQQSQDIRQQASEKTYGSGCMDRTDCVHAGGTVGNFCGNGMYFCNIPIPDSCTGTCMSQNCSAAYMVEASGSCSSGQFCCRTPVVGDFCGDDTCNYGEDYNSCPEDCEKPTEEDDKEYTRWVPVSN